MKYFLPLLFFFAVTYSGPIEIIDFDGPHPNTNSPYHEDGMKMSRNPLHIPFFLSTDSDVLDFSEYTGPTTFDGSIVYFEMLDLSTFSLLSIDIVGETDESTNFSIFGKRDEYLRFQAFGPPDGVIRPTVGTHSLLGYDFLSNISTFSIRGSGLSAKLDNIVLHTSPVPEPSTLSLISSLLIGGFVYKRYRRKEND